MNKRMKCSRGHAVAAIASIAAAMGMLILRVEIRGRLLSRVSEAKGEEREAAAKLASMSDFDEAHLSALRESVSRFRHTLGADSTCERALGSLGRQWMHEAEAATQHGAYSTRYHRIHMTSPSVADWPRIVDTVAFLEGCPGVQIDGIEMKSSGSAAQRSLDYVAMRLVVQTRCENSSILSK